MPKFQSVRLLLAIVFVSSATIVNSPCWLQSAHAEPTQQLAAAKTISPKELAKYKSVSVSVEQDGKQVKYTGVPLRVILAEMLPHVKLESMPEWKALSRRELVMVVKGDDGYPGLVTAIELSINKTGDRFVLATQKDGKLIESGVQLICKGDDASTRWVRNVVSLRVSTVSK